ncbi:TPA: hypothetical protein DCW38_06585 [candidate division WOR-3 bacterium]|jgi:tRNA G18 (ribose-2'-O)-methylase SpoU|uniref:tRNA/rRNA methyltransferase SpoU type domain-containing protein n=1 Tax=candidate division WOR-3 bacterium TaxID=2052148 RepID=A0A350HBB4_UNCW3|nr:hypothetical protein [candidate division WOR-3 bacterium]
MIVNSYVILDNLRSAHNVGNIYRSAYTFGYKGIIHVGVTPEKNNPNFLSSSRGCEEHLEYCRFSHIIEAIEFSKSLGLKIFSLEIREKAKKLNSALIEESFALILGNEALGVSETAIELSDRIFTIETPGYKDSLNVAVAFGIFSYSTYIRH